ncbi:alpha-amylase family glycosyl hydrolase [Herpetosiphon sp. NSE202]|uniref:alpha-amylase family glycosyl hydrolase n=1 Tax=Herpetosiphon sp. NSE202 TaxID=3351349 RepID=UPI003643394F
MHSEANTDASPTVASLPDGVWMGAHDQGNGKVAFALYAPWKQSVHLIGSFNDWDQTADPMSISDRGVWWIIKENLTPGEHAYQFVVDGETIIGDPYARELRWAGGDQPQAIIHVGEPVYEWHDADFGIRPLNELVIYEIHVGDFSEAGTFKAVTERIPYLQDLGVNALELMPLFEFPGDRSWGYNPAYFFAPESTYGTPADLRELIDTAHQHGIGVILDVVFNHVDHSSPINYLYPYDQSPFFSSDGNPWGFPDLNHWNEAVKQLMSDVQQYWLSDMHVDGFRYDHAEGIGFDGENGVSFLGWQARQVKPHVYLIAENLKDYTGMVLNTDMDSSWHRSFHSQMFANLREGDFEGNQYGNVEATMGIIDFRNAGYSDNAQAINYLESHDEQRIIYEAQTNGNISRETAYLKSRLGAIVLFTAAGVPMLYHGQEFGMDTERTIDKNVLKWELLETPEGSDLHAFYRGMIQLRTSSKALVGNNVQPIAVDAERKLLAYYRWADDGSEHVIVVVNFGITLQYLDVHFPVGGLWHEWVYNYDRETPEGVATIEVPGSGGKVFVLR